MSTFRNAEIQRLQTQVISSTFTSDHLVVFLALIGCHMFLKAITQLPKSLHFSSFRFTIADPLENRKPLS